MTNTAQFSATDLLACFGEYASQLPNNLAVRGISTDTRTLERGNAFIALRGEHFDGHAYIMHAIDKGAHLIIAQNAVSATVTVPTLVVPDTLHALGTLAWYHRRRFSIPIIAIGGSAGKTSTKDLAAHVLRQRYSVLQTQANYNNRIGTPHTLLQLTNDHTAAVIEIGTNEPGEIEILCSMVQPTHGLITQIGKEHLEKLIDLDGVEREEITLFEYLRDHGGLMLVNADDERLAAWYAKHGGRGLSFCVEERAPGAEHLLGQVDVRISLSFNADLHPILHVTGVDGGMRAVMQTTGYAAGLNAAAAYTIGKALELDAHQLKDGLESFQPAPSHGYARMSVQRSGTLTILNDTYNANPESMQIALRTLAMYPARRRIAVLGDMRELGAASNVEHARILERAMQVANVVIVHGSEFSRSAQSAMESNRSLGTDALVVLESHHDIALWLEEHAGNGAVVLVKGSRGMEMERIVESLLNHG